MRRYFVSGSKKVFAKPFRTFILSTGAVFAWDATRGVLLFCMGFIGPFKVGNRFSKMHFLGQNDFLGRGLSFFSDAYRQRKHLNHTFFVEFFVKESWLDCMFPCFAYWCAQFFNIFIGIGNERNRTECARYLGSGSVVVFPIFFLIVSFMGYLFCPQLFNAWFNERLRCFAETGPTIVSMFNFIANSDFFSLKAKTPRDGGEHTKYLTSPLPAAFPRWTGVRRLSAFLVFRF